VRVVEVDVLGPESAQAGFDLLDDVSARQPAVVDARPDRLAGLAGDHHFVASAGECAAEELFGGLAFGSGRRAGPVEDRQDAVGIRGVEEVDAEVERDTNDPVDVVRPGRHAEGWPCPGRSWTPSHRSAPRGSTASVHLTFRLRLTPPSHGSSGSAACSRQAA
jgi:hypothetical protein